MHDVRRFIRSAQAALLAFGVVGASTSFAHEIDVNGDAPQTREERREQKRAARRAAEDAKWDAESDACDARFASIRPLREALESASAPHEVARLASDVDAHVREHPRTDTAESLLRGLGAAWMKLERWDRADAAFASAAMQDPDGGFAGRLLRAEVSIARGDVREARARLTRAARAPSVNTHFNLMDAGNTRSWAMRRLATFEESLGEWSRALDAWTSWRPTSWCGNCGSAMRADKICGIARCRFESGDRSQAMADVWALVSRPVGFVDSQLEQEVLFLDMSLRAGTLAEARRLLLGLPDGDASESAKTWDASTATFKRRSLACLAVAEAASKATPETLLAAVDGLPFDSNPSTWERAYHDPGIELQFAARSLRRLGAAGREALEARIGDGDARAVVLAGLSGFEELRPALEAARARDESLSAMVTWSLARLDASKNERVRPESLMGG